MAALYLLLPLLFTATHGLVPLEQTTDIQNEIKLYQTFVDTLFNTTMVKRKNQVYEKVSEFVDKIGNRPAGSHSLEKGYQYFIDDVVKTFGVHWNETTMTGENSDPGSPRVSMYKEPVTFRPWKRNDESAQLISPRSQRLHILGLGFSVPTPAEGITADVVVVRSFQELRRVRHLVPGKIVLFNQEYASYDHTVKYRTRAASEAAKLGAVAVLIRSVTTSSLQTPHTGSLVYQTGEKQIPAACVSVEDAQMMARMLDRNEQVTVKLVMNCETLEQVESGNLVVEIKGSAEPEEVVLLGGHLDSWDVGLGAMDNAAGAMISYEAMKLIYESSGKSVISPATDAQFPRRTVRMVLWTAEEIGYHGGLAHFHNQKNNLANITMVMELDTGTFKPIGVKFNGEPRSIRIMREITKLFSKIDATSLKVGKAGGDTVQFRDAYVPSLLLVYSQEDNDRYFKYHHSEADNMAALDAGELDMCAAMWTGIAAVVADITETLI